MCILILKYTKFKIDCTSCVITGKPVNKILIKYSSKILLLFANNEIVIIKDDQALTVQLR